MRLKKIIYVVLVSCLISQAIANEVKHFLVLSDLHLERPSFHKMDFTPYNRFFMNDLDSTSFQALMFAINENMDNGLLPKPDFVINLGDLVGHIRLGSNVVWNSETAVFGGLSTLFPNTPMLYTFGNNDSFQGNYGSFSSENSHEQLKTPLDAAFATGKWGKHFISNGDFCNQSHTQFPCLITEDTSQGYYSAYLAPGFRVIALNSVMFAANHAHKQEDIVRQFSWLTQQLQQAANNQESIVLTMHIPPGSNVYDNSLFWQSPLKKEFIQTIEPFRESIIGILAGHTHMDGIKIIQDSSQQIIAGVYQIPALSTSHGNAPAIRMFSYEKQGNKWQLLDYTTYYFIRTAKNQVSLKKLYSYRDVYCNQDAKNMTDCLPQVSADKVQQYLSAGNSNYCGQMAYPENIKESP